MICHRGKRTDCRRCGRHGLSCDNTVNTVPFFFRRTVNQTSRHITGNRKPLMTTPASWCVVHLSPTLSIEMTIVNPQQSKHTKETKDPFAVKYNTTTATFQPKRNPAQMSNLAAIAPFRRLHSEEHMRCVMTAPASFLKGMQKKTCVANEEACVSHAASPSNLSRPSSEAKLDACTLELVGHQP